MKRIVKICMLFVFLSGIVSVGGCINSSLYFPEKKIVETPRSIHLNFKDYFYLNSSGNRIHSWWIPADSSRYTVLFCHGNGGNISHRLRTIKILNDLRLNVFIFDYSGYGKSEGRPGEKETYRDAEGAWKFLTEDLNINPSLIIIWGRSLGGAVAVDLAVGKKPAGLIVESSFSSLEKVVSDHTSSILKPFGVRGKYRSIDKIIKITVPVCIVHSRDDDIIPYYHGKLLFAQAREPRQFVSIAGSHNHGFYKSRKRYISEIDKFLGLLQGR